MYKSTQSIKQIDRSHSDLDEINKSCLARALLHTYFTDLLDWHVYIIYWWLEINICAK